MAAKTKFEKEIVDLLKNANYINYINDDTEVQQEVSPPDWRNAPIPGHDDQGCLIDVIHALTNIFILQKSI